MSRGKEVALSLYCLPFVSWRLRICHSKNLALRQRCIKASHILLHLRRKGAEGMLLVRIGELHQTRWPSQSYFAFSQKLPRIKSRLAWPKDDALTHDALINAIDSFQVGGTLQGNPHDIPIRSKTVNSAKIERTPFLKDQKRRSGERHTRRD